MEPDPNAVHPIPGYDKELTGLLVKLQWWNRPVSEIQDLIPLLTSSDLAAVKQRIRSIMD